MTADEDQPQSIIFELRGLLLDLPAVLQSACQFGERSIGPGTPPQYVNGSKSARRNHPGPGTRRNSIARPSLQSCREGVLQCFFGQVEISKQTNQGRENAARL